MKDADYRRKTAETAEAKRETLAEREQVRAERSHYANHLDVVLHRLQTQLIGDQTQLAQLAQTDPAAWVAENAKFQQRYADYQQAITERQALTQRESAEQQAQQREWLDENRKLLHARLPEWQDSKVAEKESVEIAEYLLAVGYPQEELAGLTDYRALLIARDAAKWQAHQKSLQSARGKQAAKEPSKPIKPGTTTQNQQSNTAYNDALKRARKSGSDDDVMAVLAAKRMR